MKHTCGDSGAARKAALVASIKFTALPRGDEIQTRNDTNAELH